MPNISEWPNAAAVCFVVSSAREGFNPAEVLFEFDGVRRDSAPCRSAWQEATASAGNSTESAGGTISGKQVFPTLQASMGSKLWPGNQEAFSGDYFVVHGTQDPLTQDNQAFPLGRNHGQENVVYCGTQNDACRDVGREIAPTLRAGNGGGAVNPIANVYGIPGNWIGRKPENGGNATEPMMNIAPCQTKTDKHAVAIGILGGLHPNAAVDENLCPTITQAMGMGGGHVPVTNGLSTGMVRRLTPVECERLQGFPDNHTQIPYRNKPADKCPDGPRYAACGNSMAVPVMNWIGRRIQDVIMQISL